MPWDFTETWQWVAFFLAVFGPLGVMMAVQTFLQMWFGGPKLSVQFNEHNLEGARLLQATIYNPPISGRFRKIANFL